MIENSYMSTLLVQSCSATKNQVTEPTRAIDVYDGYFFRIIKKAIRENEFRAELDVCILSAEHGLIEPNEKIVTYDRRMTADRAAELRDSVTDDLIQQIERGGYDKIILNTGSAYESAIGDVTDHTNATLVKINGDGIGDKGKQLKQLIRSEDGVNGAVV